MSGEGESVGREDGVREEGGGEEEGGVCTGGGGEIS